MVPLRVEADSQRPMSAGLQMVLADMQASAGRAGGRSFGLAANGGWRRSAMVGRQCAVEVRAVVLGGSRCALGRSAVGFWSCGQALMPKGVAGSDADGFMDEWRSPTLPETLRQTLTCTRVPSSS